MKLSERIPHELLNNLKSDEEGGPILKNVRNADAILMQLLQQHYRTSHLGFKVLLAEVAQDLELQPTDITNEILFAWKPSYRHLSEEEVSMQHTSPEVSVFPFYKRSNSQWRGRPSETTLKTCSSVICMDRSKVYISERVAFRGRWVAATIQHFFEHSLGTVQSTFAFLHVFGDIKADSNSQLHHVRTDHFQVGLALASNLPPPLVSAVDEADQSTLWLLNFKPT